MRPSVGRATIDRSAVLLRRVDLRRMGRGPSEAASTFAVERILSRGIEPCILDFWPCVRGNHVPTVGNGAVDEGMHS